MILALLGIYSSIRYNHGKRVAAMYAGLLFVSFGSMSFHATLKYTTQLLDELPMLYLCAISLYSLVEIDKDIKFGLKLPAMLAMFQSAITLIYIFWIQHPAFHQAAFGLTALGTIFYAYKRLVQINPCNKTQRALSRAHLLGHIGMWGGFFVWNIDNIFCHQLRSYRSYLGFPFDALLQLHGWWHILTAYGSTNCLLYVHLIRLAWHKQDQLFAVHYYMGMFPYITTVQPKKLD
ncbi:alkaline ceramidase ydc1 [Coemansia sp. RSA 1365]|nr:alkaline ceramidase ydc1 [Coemansia sp. RSA 1365]